MAATATAKKKKPARTPATTTDATAAGWAAVGYVAGKSGNRDALADGGRTRVSLEITGKVGRKQFSEAIEGHLLVGEQQPTTTTVAADPVALVANLLARMTGPKRAAFCADMKRPFSKHRCLPAVTDEIRGDAEPLLQGLRVAGKAGKKRGSVTFEHATA